MLGVRECSIGIGPCKGMYMHGVRVNGPGLGIGIRVHGTGGQGAGVGYNRRVHWLGIGNGIQVCALGVYSNGSGLGIATYGLERGYLSTGIGIGG